MIEFKKECGAIISPQHYALSIIDGHIGHVDFPEDLILDIHKRVPGNIFKLAHTHPIGMTELSIRDIQTMETLAFTLYPFPIRMSTITWGGDSQEDFIETTYFGYLEPRSIWLNKRTKENPQRKFTVEVESIEKIYGWDEAWKKILIGESFKGLLEQFDIY